jgi:hypothetical protein
VLPPVAARRQDWRRPKQQDAGGLLRDGSVVSSENHTRYRGKVAEAVDFS